MGISMSSIVNMHVIKSVASVLCVVLFYNVEVLCTNSEPNPDLHLNTIGLAIKNGYPAEKHFATTLDGFQLEMHRIPYSNQSPASITSTKPIAFLQHGLMGTSANWILNGRNSSLAYLLADAGYDVWMGNARASTYSQTKNGSTPSQSSYWQFSYHEKGIYDLPAMIDAVLAVTKQKKIFYVGHSLGNTMLFIMLAEKPEYNANIRAAFCLSPVAYVQNVQHPLFQFLSRLSSNIQLFATIVGAHEFAPRTPIIQTLEKTQCSHSSMPGNYCENILFKLFGFETTNWNQTMLPVLISHASRGVSVKEMVHWGQSVRNGGFCQYDYGPTVNQQWYGTATPKCYALSNVVCPVALHVSESDVFTPQHDTAMLATMLPNVVAQNYIKQQGFNHMDFIWANVAKTLVYDEVLTHMKNF